MKIGIKVEFSGRKCTIAFDPEYFMWTPGHIESGTSTPGDFFDCYTDRYDFFGWLGFTVFYARILA